MPPKKKARLLSRAASTLSGDTQSGPLQVAEGPQPLERNDMGNHKVLSDPWTDEQEISLFKSMIKWKPVGMHKHFRMIAISQQLRNHGYTTSRDNHTRIPGIWEKLRSLYNLEALDEREDSFGEGISEYSKPTDEPYCQFTLPEEEFGDNMFSRRLAPPGSSSPPSLPHQLSNESSRGARRPSTIEDTEEPRSSPASSRGQRSVRGARASKATRRSRLQESTPVSRSRKGKASDGEDGNEDDEEQEGGARARENEGEDKDETATPSARESRGTSRTERGRRPGRGRKGTRRGTRRR